MVKSGRKVRRVIVMGQCKFIYVFTKEAMKKMKKRGYTLLREDAKNQMWIFEAKEGEEIDFSTDFQCVMSDVLSF